MLRRNNQSIVVKILETNLFPCGKVFFTTNHAVFPEDHKKTFKNAFMVHNNWIVGKSAKIYRFKEIGMWYVDSVDLNKKKDTKSRPTSVGGYYSNPQRLYLTYENTLDFGEADTLQHETNALKSALYIGHLLNRTVILPSFNCYGCYRGNRKTNNCGNGTNCSPNQPNVTGRAMGKQADRCYLLAQYNLDTFDAQFSGLYREHEFLQHPKVPDAVKLGYSPLKLIESLVSTRHNLANDLGDKNIFTPADLKTGATRAEILSWLAPFRDLPLLRFHSLYSATSQLKTDNIDDQLIIAKLESGCKKNVSRLSMINDQ